MSSSNRLRRNQLGIQSFLRTITTITLLVGPLRFCAGCGSDSGGVVAVRKPAAQRPDIDSAAVVGGKMTIPAGAAFNYRSADSDQKGTARGDAKSTSPDGAECRAQADDGGQASGRFLLGYCFDNTTSAPLDADLKIRLKLTCTINPESTPAEAAAAIPAVAPDPAVPAPAHLATASLTFFIKDTNGILLKTETLETADLQTGANASSATRELAFSTKFEPERGYYLMLSGNVQAAAAHGRSVSAALEVTDVSYEINWQPKSPRPANP